MLNIKVVYRIRCNYKGERNKVSVVISLSREQFINLFNTLRTVLIKDPDAQSVMDTLIRAASSPLTHGARIAILLVDENQNTLVSALLANIKEGGIPRIPDGIESVETIDLSLEGQGVTLKEVFKSGITRESAKLASQIIQSKYRELWTVIVVSIGKIKELFDVIFPTGIKGDLLSKLVRMTIDKSLKDEILLEPVPPVVLTLQRLFGSSTQ